MGATRPVPIDVWVISATNADLRADVQDHKFRRDLYERLDVIAFVLPPLRERPGDIVDLAERFLARSCAEYALRPKRFAADAQRRLLDHSWPGNVRELSNVIERAALLVDGDAIPASRLELASPVPVSVAPAVPAPTASRAERRERILEALERHGGNITRTAADLGVSRKTLRDWMRQRGLYPRSRDLVPSAPDPEREPPEHGEPAAARDGVETLIPGLTVTDVAAPRTPSSPWTLPETAPGTKADIHWERRWVTLLQVSLTLDDDDGRVLDSTRLLEIIADKVQTFGGRVIELGRSGLEAAFGLDPLEDAAQRAAYAALAIQRAGTRARKQSSVTPAARIALHADSYVVGRMGASTQIDQDAKQAASALLATLVAAATPEGVVASHTVLPFLRRRFDLDGPVASDTAGPVYRLLGRADRPLAFDTQISSFVGRESEIELLQNRWEPGHPRPGQIVGIVGDPGVGKSRLVWEFVHGGPGAQALVLETASVALGRPTPYLAIIEMLRADFRSGGGRGRCRHPGQGGPAPPDLDPSLAASLPAFLSLLDVPTEDSAWEALDPNRRRQRTFDAIKRLMLRESARQPLLLVFEDAHWADSETKALLEAVADSLPVARVLMLVTFRPEYEHGWGQRTFYTQVRVDPLRGEGVQQFLRDLLGEHPSLDSLRATLIEWTEGNPFFLEETVWTLAETRVLEGKRGAYRMVRPVTSIAVPETVQEVLAARMARLGQSAVRGAAVSGRRRPPRAARRARPGDHVVSRRLEPGAGAAAGPRVPVRDRSGR